MATETISADGDSRIPRVPGVPDSVMRMALQSSGGNVTEAVTMAREYIQQEQKKEAAVEDGKRVDKNGDERPDDSGFHFDFKIGRTIFSYQAYNEALHYARQEFSRDPNFKDNPKLVDNASKVATVAAMAAVDRDREKKPDAPENGDKALRAKEPEAVQKVKELAHGKDFKDHLEHGKLTEHDNKLMCDALNGAACTRSELENQKSGFKQQGIEVASNEPVAAAGQRPRQNLNLAAGPTELPPVQHALPSAEARENHGADRKNAPQNEHRDHKQPAHQRAAFAP